ncbi:MAG: penicillin acylase family protein, partial [Chloroflexi bacterium]|nr:penicillin acylase family protein [Chloroflexota bacterium]
MRTGLRITAALVLVAVLTATAGAVTVVSQALPAYDGEVRMGDLERRAEVVRDKWGVPHVYAESAHDLFFLQGFVTAQDRLFQLDFNRRVAYGRLAEVLGEPVLETDRYLRTIGLGRLARSLASALDPESRTATDAFAKGVNRFVTDHRDRLPLEFRILGYQPEPWTAADSIAVGKLQALDLDGNYTTELLRAAVVQRVGASALLVLEPASEALPTALRDGGWAAVAGRLGPIAVPAGVDGLRSYLGGTLEGPGSNCWAVARSRGGKPLLAGDPHLGVRNPATWYEIGLHGAGYDVAGFSLPGVPAVLIGHNDRVAWSFTAAFTDTQDLYVEQPDPLDPRRFLHRGVSERATVIRESIRVKGRPEPVVLDVIVTRHGPLLTPVLKGQNAPLALRWTALEPHAGLDGVLALARARDFASFRAALALIPGPTVTACYADVDGHIGWAHAGLIPIRPRGGDGRLPV